MECSFYSLTFDTICLFAGFLSVVGRLMGDIASICRSNLCLQIYSGFEKKLIQQILDFEVTD